MTCDCSENARVEIKCFFTINFEKPDEQIPHDILKVLRIAGGRILKRN